ncbi:MAG: thermonuclease family protein [Bacteroidota bacterium]
MRSWLVLLLCVGTCCLRAQNFQTKITGVVNGDTFEFLDEEKVVVRVLLSEVDAPEVGQEFSDEASAFSKKLLLKKKVTVEYKGKDFFGNKLAIITLKNGRKIHDLLLENGLAMVRERKKDPQLLKIQQQAKSSKVGVWSIKEPVTPWVYRRQQTMRQAKSR